MKYPPLDSQQNSLINTGVIMEEQTTVQKNTKDTDLCSMAAVRKPTVPPPPGGGFLGCSWQVLQGCMQNQVGCQLHSMGMPMPLSYSHPAPAVNALPCTAQQLCSSSTALDWGYGSNSSGCKK